MTVRTDEEKHLDSKARKLFSQLSPKGRVLLDQFVDGTIDADKLLGSVSKDDLEELLWFCRVDSIMLKRHQDKQVAWARNVWLPKKRAEIEARQKERTNRGLPRDPFLDQRLAKTEALFAK